MRNVYVSYIDFYLVARNSERMQPNNYLLSYALSKFTHTYEETYTPYIVK